MSIYDFQLICMGDGDVVGRRRPRAGGREPSLSTVLFWPVTQYLMNIVIFKWVAGIQKEGDWKRKCLREALRVVGCG